MPPGPPRPPSPASATMEGRAAEARAPAPGPRAGGQRNLRGPHSSPDFNPWIGLKKRSEFFCPRSLPRPPAGGSRRRSPPLGELRPGASHTPYLSAAGTPPAQPPPPAPPPQAGTSTAELQRPQK
ncbi:basic proline-rich protein-like [Suricata suricatta]|uniref:basic proline-rich protein-like n=1 Tax=Suricata suricatta TaxID=37032 RepID=UPI001155B3C1|nr:basic proline-rich protein-like [Suricata suricatta]